MAAGISVNTVEKRWYRHREERKNGSARTDAGINGGTVILTGCREKPSTNLSVLTVKSPLQHMEIKKGYIAAMSVILPTGLGVAGMSEGQFRDEKMYHATMNIAKTLMGQGAMTEEEYGQIDTIFREKYHPILVSLRTEISGYKAESMASCDTERKG